MTAETFGPLLRRLRRERRMSTHTLAARAFVSPSTIMHLENDRSQQPFRETVSSIAAGMALDGVDTARLLIAAGYFPWRMSDAAVTAFAEAVEQASAMGTDEPAFFRRKAV